jgi:hypothetical protein
MIDPCCDPRAIEIAMLEAELFGLGEEERALIKQLEASGKRGSPQREALFCHQFAIEVAMLDKRADLATLLGDHARAQE